MTDKGFDGPTQHPRHGRRNAGPRLSGDGLSAGKFIRGKRRKEFDADAEIAAPRQNTQRITRAAFFAEPADFRADRPLVEEQRLDHHARRCRFEYLQQ